MGSMVTSDPSVFVRKQREVSALAAWGKCKQQGAAVAALDDLWIESLDPSRLRGLKAPGGVAINGLPDPGSEFFRISAWRHWTAVGGSWFARVRDSSQLRAAMLTLVQAKGVGSTHVGEGAMPAVAGEGMDRRGSYLPGAETSLNEGARASGSPGSDPPTVSAAVDELLSSTPSSMLGGEGEGTRIKAEVQHELAHDLAYRGLIPKVVVHAVVDPQGVLEDKECKAAGDKLASELMVGLLHAGCVMRRRYVNLCNTFAQPETGQEDSGAAGGECEDVEASAVAATDVVESQDGTATATETEQLGVEDDALQSPREDMCLQPADGTGEETAPSSGGNPRAQRRAPHQAERDAERRQG
eukprot:gene10053-11895_t